MSILPRKYLLVRIKCSFTHSIKGRYTMHETIEVIYSNAEFLLLSRPSFTGVIPLTPRPRGRYRISLCKLESTVSTLSSGILDNCFFERILGLLCIYHSHA